MFIKGKCCWFKRWKRGSITLKVTEVEGVHVWSTSRQNAKEEKKKKKVEKTKETEGSIKSFGALGSSMGYAIGN